MTVPVVECIDASKSFGDVAAVDDQVVAVDERRPGGEKEDGLGHLVGLAKAPGGNLGENAVAAHRVLGIAVPVEPCGDRPRADGVDDNAVGGQFKRHRPRQMDQRRLGQSVKRQFGLATMPIWLAT